MPRLRFKHNPAALPTAQVSEGNPLFYMGLAMFKKYGLSEAFGIAEDRLHNFLHKVEAGYRSNEVTRGGPPLPPF